jgi:hypothetical protein
VLVSLNGKHPTNTVVTSSLNPSQPGQLVTFTAQVTGASGVPTGEVWFRDGTTVVATGSLNAAGTVTYATTGLGSGTHAIRAEYRGDLGNGGSTSPH